jgi:hypothetical protein
MSPESRRVAGIVFIVLPTVMFGGVSILRLLMGDPDYMANPLRQDLWRAGHAHAGVLLVFLSVLSPDAREPNALINLAYLGALSLATGVLILGFGLLRSGDAE